MREDVKARLLISAAGLTVIALGLGSRYGLSGFWAKYLGVAFWAAMLYLTLLFMNPRLKPLHCFLLALAGSWIVEFAQLTPGPAWLSARHPLLRMIFGATFSVPDLAAYALCAGAGALLHLAASSRNMYSTDPKGSRQNDAGASAKAPD